MIALGIAMLLLVVIGSSAMLGFYFVEVTGWPLALLIGFAELLVVVAVSGVFAGLLIGGMYFVGAFS